MKKSLLAPLFLTCMAHAASSDNDVIIPEGKIIDYPSIYHDVTPSAGPRVINGVGMFLTGDYIYWTARQNNMQYASTGYAHNVQTISPGKTDHVKFKFQTGFKAGLGFSFGHDLWDTAFNYTWFQSNHNTGSVSGSASTGLTPSFIPAIKVNGDDYFTYASALWKFHFNVVDWELGRNFYVSKYLSVRPFVGLKGTWQTQHFNTTYEGIKNSNPFSYLRKMENDFWGIGIRSGCNTTWHLAGTWSIFGDLAISALWGQFSTERTDTVIKSNQFTPIDLTNHFHTSTPVLEMALGLRKDQWFYNNRFHIAVQAGWEEQIWWDQNQFAGNLSNPIGGNLILQGLTARIRFDF